MIFSLKMPMGKPMGKPVGKQVIRLLLLGSLIGMSSLVAGCTSVAEMVFEDRGKEDIKTDSQIKAEILADVAQDVSAKTAALLGVMVYEQKVMLTGEVPNNSEKDAIVKITRNTPNVDGVINELVLPSDQGSGIDDFVINQAIHVNAAANSFINHTNWRWNSVHGVVYLFGRALTRQEQLDMHRMIKSVDNVRKIVDHSFVRAK